jgi:hypothetical protein
MRKKSDRASNCITQDIKSSPSFNQFTEAIQSNVCGVKLCVERGCVYCKQLLDFCRDTRQTVTAFIVAKKNGDCTFIGPVII